MADKRIDRLFGEVRADYVPAADFFSPDFAALEAERLWPRVWQMACREEDIPNPGDFCTYDILDNSIIVVRTAPDRIRAYHNSCPHRGNRLVNGPGHAGRFRCGFHGWQFDLEGKPVNVVDRDDWGGCLSDEDISLMEVRCGAWAGWVYINMDPDCESLESFLEPARSVHDPLRMGELRYHWKKSAIVPCNWKTVLGMFNESYHLQATHKQMLPYWDDYTVSFARGRHGMFRNQDTLPPGMPSKRLGAVERKVDLRAGLRDYIKDIQVTLDATEAMLLGNAVDRLVAEVPEDAEPMDVIMSLARFSAEDFAARGLESPQLSPEQISEIGADWHLFPNHVMLSSANACLAYRSRPNGHDPDSAIWDVYSLMRYPEGQEPKVEHQWGNDLSDEEFWPKILRQDFENMDDLRRGMKSRGFRGLRTNPKQEVAVSNFHRTLREFMGV